MCFRGIQLLSPSLPRLFAIASPNAYSPSLLLPSDLIRSLCVNNTCTLLFIHSFIHSFIIYLFSERGKGRDKERERNIDRLPLICPQMGTWPTTHACALTGSQTGDFSVCGLALNPLSHTTQGYLFFKNKVIPYQYIKSTLSFKKLCFIAT